jgi:hypothetical protein
MDSRLTYKKEPLYKVAILSPQDNEQYGTYDHHLRRKKGLRDLNIKSVLDGIYMSSQLKGVYYKCECKIFYYKDPSEKYVIYPKICPLGHPAYEDF